MHSFLKRQKDRLQFAYHGVRNWWPIWFFVLNRQSRRVWRRVAPTLREQESKIVETLLRDGIAIAHIRDLFPQGTFEALLKEFEIRKAKPFASQTSHGGMEMMQKGGKGTKTFMKYFWGGGGTNPELDTKSLFIQFALSDIAIRIVGNYFGSAPKFHGFSLQETVLVPKGEMPYLSQRWHRDPDDKKICKVFLYLNDVDSETTGPFMYVKGSQLGGKWRHLFPQRPPVGRYPDPGAVEKAVSKEDIQVCLGKAGTMVFCDTSGLHRGGYSTEKTRAMFATGFATKASVHPVNYTLPGNVLNENLSSLVKYALTL